MTGIDDPLDVGISIYPNPTTGLLKIEARQNQADLKIFLHDALGRQLLVSDCSAKSGCEFDVSQFASGLLLVTIKNRATS